MLVRYTRPRCPTTAPLPTNQKSVSEAAQVTPASPRRSTSELRVRVDAARPGAERPVPRATSGPFVPSAASSVTAPGAVTASRASAPARVADRSARPGLLAAVLPAPLDRAPPDNGPGAATASVVPVDPSTTGSGQAAEDRATATSPVVG